jgi:hypothetical protein
MREGKSPLSRPVCIFGTGRSGTTLLFKLLCSHPAVGWFSNYTNRFPRLTCLAAVSRVLNYDWARTHLNEAWSLRPRPCESYRLYNHLTDGLMAEPGRPLSAADATDSIIRRYRRCVAAHLQYQGKRKFVQKHTGYPHAGFLDAILPDACFINVVRDGRAVARSMVNVRWWDGTMKSWWWGPMDAADQAEYLASGREPIVLAAIAWKTLMRRNADARALLPDGRYMELRYHDLVNDPSGTIERVTEYCELEPSALFARRVMAVPIRDEDSKWRRDLSARQIALLEQCLEADLVRYGFSN